MDKSLELILDLGTSSLNILWFPLLIWSVLVIGIWAISRYFKKGDLLIQYHLRVTILAAFPTGLLFSAFPFVLFQEHSVLPIAHELSIISISNGFIPVPTSTPATASVLWTTPLLWIGVCTLVVGAVSIVKVCMLWLNYCNLYGCIKNTKSYFLSEIIDSPSTKIDQGEVLVGFSPEVNVPFTFGWKKPLIILPNDLKAVTSTNRDTILAHELVHIRRNDFLLDLVVEVIKVLFWFNPLVSLLAKESKIYREASCDAEVLSKSSIGRKEYAQLLYQMSTLTRNKSIISPVSISSKSSLLKKRLQFMNNANPNHRSSIAKSAVINMIILVGIAGFIGCSDLDSPIASGDKLNQINPRNPTVYIGLNDYLAVNGIETTLTEFDTFLKETPNSAIGIITLEVHPEAHFGHVTDTEKIMRKRGTFRINYGTVIK